METTSPPASTDLSPVVGEVTTGTAADGTVKKQRTVWTVISGGLGGIVGLAPHVLHHIGPLVGTALVAGAGGTALFGVLGLVASVPMLIKLRRRFSNWWAPGIALGVFTAMFLISSFVIGPLISGRDAPVRPSSPAVTDGGHSSHHS